MPDGFKINRSHLSFLKLSGFYSENNLGELVIKDRLSIWYHNLRSYPVAQTDR